MSLDQSVGGVASLEAVMLFLTTSTLVLRFVARFIQRCGFGIDDWLMVPAWLCFIGIASIGIHGLLYSYVGVASPTDKSVLASMFPAFSHSYYALDMLSTLSLGFTRLSALFFYRRVFIVSTKWDTFGILNSLLIIIVILWTLGYVLLQVFGCGNRFWELFASSAIQDCAIDPFLESVVISSFILDVLVLILPIQKIWRLHTTLARKLVLTFVFLLATAGIAASCARMVINVTSIEARHAHIKSTADIFRLGQIAVNLPSLWYLRKGIKAESILKSIRSIISLRSVHSTDRVDEGAKEMQGSASDLSGGSEVAEDDPQPTRRDKFEVEGLGKAVQS